MEDSKRELNRSQQRDGLRSLSQPSFGPDTVHHSSLLSRQVSCPGRSFVQFVCAMSSQTIDLLSKGDTQKGWEKVTTTSVMDVLKWRTGDYRVLVSDAEPML